MTRRTKSASAGWAVLLGAAALVGGAAQAQPSAPSPDQPRTNPGGSPAPTRASAEPAKASAPSPDQPRPTPDEFAPTTTAAPASDAAFGQAQPQPIGTTPQGRIEALEAQMAALQAQLAELKAATSAGFRDQRQALAASDRVSITAGKPSIASADGRSVANLHGVMQFDAADYDQRSPGPLSTDLRRGAGAADTARSRDLNSGTNFRRARIGIDGKLFGDFGYNLLYDFGGSGAEDAGRVQELWVQYTGLKPFTLRVGAFRRRSGWKTPA